jgi:hypothetical protein
MPYERYHWGCQTRQGALVSQNYLHVSMHGAEGSTAEFTAR